MQSAVAEMPQMTAAPSSGAVPGPAPGQTLSASPPPQNVQPAAPQAQHTPAAQPQQAAPAPAALNNAQIAQLLAVLRRQRPLGPPPDSLRRDPENLLRARPLTQMVGPQGERFTFVLVPVRGGLFIERGAPNRSLLLSMAVLLSAIASFLLARTIARPVRKLRETTQQLAGGDLESRVDPAVVRRRDELGLLARDFDTPEKLRSHPRLATFAAWVAKRPPGFMSKVPGKMRKR